MSNAWKCDPEQSQVFSGGLACNKGTSESVLCWNEQCWHRLGCLYLCTNTALHGRQFTHFPLERHLFMLQTLSDTITVPHHHPPVLRGRRWGSQRPSADPRIFPVSLTHGRMWIWETSNTRLGKTSTLKQLKAALSSSGCASILPQGDQHGLRIKVICPEYGWIKAHTIFFPWATAQIQ